jgi:hypothetical protein
MDWTLLKPAADDGALCDILVFDATQTDWQQVIDALRSWTPLPIYKRDGQALPLPEEVNSVLADPEVGYLLTVTANGVGFNCHFFDRDEIEFDIDPREVTDAGKAETVEGFMTLLGTVTGKAVVLTEEGGRLAALQHGAAIGRWVPETGTFVWSPQPYMSPR